MNRRVPADYLVECRRCGQRDLAWQQSKSGRWYLCAGRYNPSAFRYEADRRRFHVCPAYQSRGASSPNPRPCPSKEVRQQMGQIITHGYRALAVAAHPNHNGNTRTMQILNEAVQRLCDVWAVSSEGSR